MKILRMPCLSGKMCLKIILAQLAIGFSSSVGLADLIVLQNFDTPGSNYQTLQSGDIHAGGAMLNAPQINAGGPSGNYLQLAQRNAANGVDAQNGIVFDNTSVTTQQISVLTLQYHMQGIANGFGFMLLNTNDYGTSGGTVSSLELDRVQVEQAHNHDAIGVRQVDYYSRSIQLSLNTFENDRVQLFYDGYKLIDQAVTFPDGWYDLSMTTDFTGPEAMVHVSSKQLAPGTAAFDFQVSLGAIDAFNARPLLAARIGGAGFGDFSIDTISYDVQAVPEPSSGVLVLACASGLYGWHRRKGWRGLLRQE